MDILMFIDCLLLQYFQKDLPELVERDPENLFNLAFSMKINTKQMKKWEKEHIAFRKREQEEMGELRVRNVKFLFNLTGFNIYEFHRHFYNKLY